MDGGSCCTILKQRQGSGDLLSFGWHPQERGNMLAWRLITRQLLLQALSLSILYHTMWEPAALAKQCLTCHMACGFHSYCGTARLLLWKEQITNLPIAWRVCCSCKHCTASLHACCRPFLNIWCIYNGQVTHCMYIFALSFLMARADHASACWPIVLLLLVCSLN